MLPCEPVSAVAKGTAMCVSRLGSMPEADNATKLFWTLYMLCRVPVYRRLTGSEAADFGGT